MKPINIALISLFLLSACTPQTPPEINNTGEVLGSETQEIPTVNNPADNKQYQTVTKVVDGDTIKIGDQTIRLIGVDTPETVDPRKPVECFGIEASNKMKELVEDKKVYIENDETQGQVDKYGRTLAYIWTEEGEFINLEIIKQGYAYEYTYDAPYRYQAEFKQAEEHAKINKLGLWSDVCAEKETTTIPEPEKTYTPPATTPEPVVEPKPTPAPIAEAKQNCHPNYSGCLRADASDYDCAGGSGNGPYYTGKVQVLGPDVFKLDRDNDGWGCE